MDTTASISKLIVDNLLPGGALVTGLAEIATPSVLYPRNITACTQWVNNGRQALTVLEQMRYPLGHPCMNALGIMVDGISPITLHAIVLVPLAVIVVIYFIRSENK